MIRIVLPTHLWRLARAEREITLEGENLTSIAAVLEQLETDYPMLRGTIRDQVTHERRPYVRFFASGEDLSHEPMDARLPEEVISGAACLRIVGAMSGG